MKSTHPNIWSEHILAAWLTDSEMAIQITVFCQNQRDLFLFFFLGRIKTCSIRKVQRVSGKQKNSSGIQIKNKTSEEGGNSQQCIDTASCTGLLLCVWLPVWALHLVCYCLSKTNQREGRLEGKKKGKEKTRGGEILCICEAEGYCLSGFVPCYLLFFWY